MRNTFHALGVLAATLAVAAPCYAKPLSYTGGTMVMQENDETGHTLSLDYTFSPRYAIGLYAKQERGGKEFTTIGPQANMLLKRWNMPDGQANIFAMAGAGNSHYEGKDGQGINGFSAWSSLLADYETRRVFTSYELRGMYADGIEKSVWQRARVGVAPYIGNYDDVNTWLMLQVDDHPAKDEILVVTPLVRLFYHSALMEAGYSSNHRVMFNWVLQF